MTSTTLKRELLDLENQFWQAIKEKNTDAAMQLTDEECIVTLGFWVSGFLGF